MDKTRFNCDACGECCRHIDRIPQLRAFDDGTGVCVHLKENLCDIYENRPEVCCVDVMYNKYYSTQYTKDEFYKINEQVCRELKKFSNSFW